MKKSDFIVFFSERFKELLHRGTLDSYRVRNHYSLSLLYELDNLIDGWINNRIKLFETIKLCVEELIETLNKDICIDFSFYSKELFVDELNKYIDKNQSKDHRDKSIIESSSMVNDSNKIRFLIKKCINTNETKYTKELFTIIDDIILCDDDLNDQDYPEIVGRLDWATTTLCCVLLHQGYSKNHLYLKADKLSEKRGDSYLKSYTEMKDSFLKKKEYDYSVIFRLSVNNDIMSCKDEYGFKESVEDLLPKTSKDSEIRYKSYITPANGVLFYTYDCSALDLYSAIRKGRESLSMLFDVMNLAMTKSKINIPSMALVIPRIPGKNLSYYRKTDFVLDGTFTNDPQLSKELKRDIFKIRDNSELIEQDVQDRILSAIRHLRLGDTSSEIELRFINYWIALEFIFSSPVTNENTFNRLKRNLINILCSCYIKRNILYLDEALRNDASKPLSKMTESEWDTLISGEKSLLLQWRLCKMKSHLHSKEKIKDYITNHQQNLTWHITRIYGIRNKLIHEAALTQEIESVTSNLRYYLVFLLNQMIVYFSKVGENNTKVNMNNFFLEYEVLLEKIKKDWDRQVVLGVEIEMNLLK